MTRWWNQFETIPYPDNLAMLISASVKGRTEHCRIIRRTLARYACLSFTSTLTLISPKVKRRFPTLNHITEAGLMMPDEEKIMRELQEEYPNYPRFWLPLAWASTIAAKAREEGLIQTDQSLQAILHEINTFRTKCGGLLSYDWISIPLVYTQVVTIAVYSYFVTSVIGQQYLYTSDEIDIYFPVLAILEFFFYMGWLRVAETLINPFGEDDDDFDVVTMIDRHLQVSYLIVDKIHEEHPKLMQDQYWNSSVPRHLPYTIGSEKYIEDIPNHSTDKMTVTKDEAEVLPPGGKRSKSDSFKRNQPSLIRRLLRGQSPSNDDDKDKSIIALTSIDVPDNKPSSPISSSNISTSTKTQLEEEDRPETIDFEKLKNLRQLLLKQKVVKYMELMKEHTNEEEGKILDEILHIREDGDNKMHS
nr:bestrophin-1-like [Onthophagus taurus]